MHVVIDPELHGVLVNWEVLMPFLRFVDGGVAGPSISQVTL